MKLDEGARYAPTHEWIRLEGDEALIGISDYAQHSLGDIVFAELPGPGKSFRKGEAICVVESVKAASDVYSPASCTVLEANEALASTPGLVNSDCYGEGWLLRVRLSNPSELDSLMDAASYGGGLPRNGGEGD